MYKKTVLVTGGSGFLGHNLVLRLLNEPDVGTIISVDNHITSNAKLIADNKLKKIINLDFDICDVNFVKYITDNFEHIDEIYHFASLASPIAYKTYLIETLDVGYIGTKNILNLCVYYTRGNGPRCKMLFSSTSEVYGDALEHPQKESYYGNVNPYGERSCYSDDTEILTENGYKLFSELNINDKVATLNDNNILEYHNPYEIIKEKYVGEMYEFKNWNIDLKVTPNHKMYVKKRDYIQFELLEAKSKISWSRAGLKKTCNYIGKEKEWFYFPKELKNLQNQKTPFVEKIEMDLWLEFMGYYLSEGYTRISTQKKKANNKIYECGIFKVQISQSETIKPIYFEKIRKCLDKMPFNYNISKSGNSYFVISNKQLAFYLYKFGKSKDKYIPNELLSLSKRQLEILLDALILGDGNIRKKNNNTYKSYFSSSYQLISDVQEILLKTGTFGNILKKPNEEMYYININSRPERNYTYSTPVINQYNGYVYCVNVKNHIIFVRRNGKALFCGNCYDESKRVAESLIYNYNKLHDIDTRIVRIFNTYGPYMNINDGRIVTEIIKALLKDKTLYIFGDGTQTRSLCFVDDLIYMILKVMKSDYTSPINIGTDVEISINDLVQVTKQVYEQHFNKQTNMNIQYINIDKDDPKVRRPCLELNSRIIGDFQRTSLETGLLKTILHFA